MSEPTALQLLARKFVETDVASAARALESMNEDQVVQILEALPPEPAAELVRQLQTSYAAAILKSAQTSLFRGIARQLEPGHAAAIFMHLPSEAREKFLAQLPPKLKREVREQLTFPEDSVGRLMTTQFLAFHQHLKVRDVIERIRGLARKRYPASYAYVVDEQNHLLGVINMRDLMLAAPTDKLESVMRKDLFTLHCFAVRDEAAAELSKRRYFAAPVVDHEGRILGIIKAEQLIRDVQDELTSDIQRMFGAGGDERAFSPIRYSLGKRLPWLMVNLGTAFLAAAVVAMFEGIIAKLTVLAVFLPVVAGQGGNAGAQSLAIVMRGLVMREVPREKVGRLIRKEAVLGIITGAATGLVTAVVAWFWQGKPYLGLVIFLGMVVNLFAAGLSGAAIPIIMKRLGLDPAQCSSIVLTTVTDVVGFLAFLGFAVMFQRYLL